ncbi:hypothetical protein SELMODRAFT_127173 [Selaginella moellendorffii]|uniref:cytokinin dehydrogenase n=2 Tax=Selaginella moellendorffii TaxID=88036 RepID=D8SXN5_SELML|nr:hypothetical protein SELMODRAFT_127173 [Selaginella moellendorffii]
MLILSWGQILALLLLFVRTAIVGLANSSCSGSPLSAQDCAALSSLSLHGHITFATATSPASSSDFGRIHRRLPRSILYPSSVRDIASLVRAVHDTSSPLRIAARGAGHSVAGQAQAGDGVVIEMGSLRGIKVSEGKPGEQPYVEAMGGELWIDVVRESLKYGLAPRSLTDYLFLSVGGTLSNAGVSGQAFRYGPQISNVLELEVVTGNGEIVRCSPVDHADLFFAVLGGLGQFGIITKAKINLERAPQKVKWIRALYSDFKAFTRDQELLIARPKDSPNSFDYVEGSVIVNNNHPSNEYKPIPFHGQTLNASLIPPSAGPVLYCLELTKNYDEDESATIDETVSSLLAPLGHVPSLVFSKDASYFEFLNRVHDGEIRLRKKGLWDVPHPWMNLLVPKSKIEEFDALVFREILRKGINGPLLVYPLDKMKWDSRTSVVMPDENIFYLVGMLRYATPSGVPSVNSLVDQNKEILRVCKSAGIHLKQYIPQLSSEEEWREHYGSSWSLFLRRKLAYDPKAILAPGQNIFAPSSSTLKLSSAL